MRLFKNKKKKTLGNYSIKVEHGIQSCAECKKHNIGLLLYEALNWKEVSNRKIIIYNKEKEKIIVSEEGLMRLIQLVNPTQERRKIELV